MRKQDAERIYEYYVGDYVNSKEFTRNGRIDEDAIEAQVAYAKEQGWLPGGTLDIEEDELRIAIRTIASDDLK